MWYIFFITFILSICAIYIAFLREKAMVANSNFANKLNKQIKISDKILFLIIIFTLFLLSAFRHPKIGSDTETYTKIFEFIIGNGRVVFNSYEVGFQSFCLFLSIFSNDPQILLIGSSLFCYLLIGIYIEKYVEDKTFAICLVFAVLFGQIINIIRQMMAMVILLWAYKALENKKVLFSFLLTFLAFLFHTSGISFLLVIIASYIKFNKKIFVYILLLVLILIFSGEFLTNILKKIFYMYANYFNDDRIKTGILATLLAIIRFGIVLSIYIQTRKESNNIHNWIFAITLFFYVLAL